MRAENVDNALAILAMLRPSVEEAQRIVDSPGLDSSGRARLKETLAAMTQAIDGLDSLLSEP